MAHTPAPPPTGHRPTQHGLHERQGYPAVQVVPLAGVSRILGDAGDDDQISPRPAERAGVTLSRDPQLGAGVEARGQQDVERRTARRDPAPATHRARRRHPDAGTVTGGAPDPPPAGPTPDGAEAPTVRPRARPRTPGPPAPPPRLAPGPTAE